MTAIFTGAVQVTCLTAIFSVVRVHSRYRSFIQTSSCRMLVVASAEAVTVFQRRALARLYSRCTANDVPGEALCDPASIAGRTRDLASEGEVQCEGHSHANLASEPHPRAVSLGLSLPPVRLPQALEQAVKRVLAGTYVRKQVRLLHHTYYVT